MSSSSASATSNNSVHASTSAHAVEKPIVLVAGEARDSVTVQSQLATSTVAGDVTSHSNIGQVITDLGAAHTATSGWVDAETVKINTWGQSEIQRILTATKGMEQQLIKGAQEKQIALDNSHKGELALLVQKLDLQKAAELKELEDALQRQIQGVLTTSKNDINRIETEMNNRKMELIKQSQITSAKEIDALSNLVVETKLVPSQTRTVIETNTNTGSVIAIATGGTIATGQASSEAISSQKIAAVPNAGELRQEVDVKTGDMIRDADQRKVGEGAIVSTMTGVTAQTTQQHPVVPARPYEAPVSHSTSTSAPIALGGHHAHTAAAPAPVSHSTSTAASTNSSTTTTVQHADGQRLNASGITDSRAPGASVHVPLATTQAYNKNPVTGDKPIDAAYGKSHPAANEPHHQKEHLGLMDKVKNALTGHHEPKSTDAHKRV